MRAIPYINLETTTKQQREPLERYMVVSQNEGTPIESPKYYRGYYWDPQKGYPEFWEIPI